ncbi:MAG: hypothetical protein K0R24_1665 [Gammaproteobacteria bacterium]|jgi:hypothetical protein|nr:hypothetical protein [Gammaproteobacteria bacterium]MCE3238684.1 hypothetical protein [Gammaproteobacteria bacterium]
MDVIQFLERLAQTPYHLMDSAILMGDKSIQNILQDKNPEKLKIFLQNSNVDCDANRVFDFFPDANKVFRFIKQCEDL